MTLRHAIHQEQYWEIPPRCPLISCSKQYNTLPEMIDHLETCPELTPHRRPRYLCPKCLKERHVPGMGYRLDLKNMGKSIKKCIDDALDFSSPDGSTTMSDRSSMFGGSDVSMSGKTREELEKAPTIATHGVQELQAQYPFDVSPQNCSHLVDFDGQNGPLYDYSSFVPQNLSLSIPGKDESFPGNYVQTSPDGPFATSASTLMSSVQSANSEQTSRSSYGGSTLVEGTSPSSGYFFGPDTFNSPPYECSQNTPMSTYPQISEGLPSSYVGFSQGEGAAYIIGQDNCNMSGYPGGMEIYSPSFDAPNDSRELFQGQALSYSVGVPCSVPESSLVQPTANMHESKCPVTVVSSQPTNCTSTVGDDSGQNTLPNGLTNLVRCTCGTDIPGVGCESKEHHCNICKWTPDDKTKIKRDPQKMQQAVRKHIKRNHHTKNFICEFCGITIHKRFDNMRDHVRRKHSDQSAYPDSKTKRRQSEGSSYGTTQTPQQKRMKSKQGYITPEYSP